MGTRKKYKAAVIIDNKIRDLDGGLLLAKCLLEWCEDVLLLPMNLQQFELYFVEFDFVVFSSLRNYNEPLVFEVLNSGRLVGISDTEGGVFTDLAEYLVTLPKTKRTFNKHNLFFYLWGKKQYENFQKSGLIKQEQIEITGCPRFDMFANNGETYLRSLVGKTDRKSVLVNTNHPIANPKFGTPAKEIEVLLQAGMGIDKARWIQNLQAAEMAETIRLVKTLSSSLECDIIVRPHPFENMSRYKGEFENYDNVSIENNSFSGEAIYQSACIIQRGCTTGFEAGLLSKPSLLPDWTPYEYTTYVNQLSTSFKDKNELIQEAKKVLSGSNNYKVPPKLAEVIENYFFKIDGKSSSRVSNHAKSRIKKFSRTGFSLFDVKSFLKRSVLMLLPRFCNKYRDAYEAAVFNYEASEKHISHSEVNMRLTQLNLDLVVDHVYVSFGGVGKDRSRAKPLKTLRLKN